MRRLVMSLALTAALLAPQPAFAGQPSVGVVTNFGPNLAAVCPMPEGIAVDPTGNLYASSFAFKPIANICVENRSGQIIDVIPVAAGRAGVASLLGELFEPSQGLYVLDFADGTPTNGRLLRVNVQTHAVTVVATGFQAPNPIAPDRHRNLYVCANSAQHPAPGLPGEIQVLSPDARLIARYDGLGQHDLDFPASLVFHERALYIANLALDSGGVNSKLSILGVPYPGLPLRP